MQEFIQFLLTQIVTKPEEVSVNETREDTVVRLKIKVAKEDMGLIIGKQGKTINSIRDVARAKAIKEGVKVYVDIVEDENTEENVEA